jgi:hypothetical protein
LHCYAAEKFNHSRSFFIALFERVLRHLRLASSKGLTSSNCKNTLVLPNSGKSITIG